jgi:hypothetical protein
MAEFGFLHAYAIRKIVERDSLEEENTTPHKQFAFLFRRYRFVLAQTEVEQIYRVPITGLAFDKAPRDLNITRVPFDEINGNILGFARVRAIVINPSAPLPHKTAFHEIAHIVLGHTTLVKLVDAEETAWHIGYVEAESVALICCETLGLEGAEMILRFASTFETAD